MTEKLYQLIVSESQRKALIYSVQASIELYEEHIAAWGEEAYITGTPRGMLPKNFLRILKSLLYSLKNDTKVFRAPPTDESVGIRTEDAL